MSKQMLPISRQVTANIRRLRRARGLSARALAEEISRQGHPVSEYVIAQYECGVRRTLPLDYVACAARALGVMVGLLLGEEPCPKCQGTPPVGFTCNACGAVREEASRAES
jgi:transcriptional regulator with XRE-family HTH domain